MTIPLQCASLYGGQEVSVWSDCLLDLGTHFPDGNDPVWSSAVRVNDSQAYRKMDVTRERISRILELREMLLSLQTGFNLVNAAAVCAILESISALPSISGLGAGIACWSERRTREQKVASSNPCKSGGRMFFSRVNFVC